MTREKIHKECNRLEDKMVRLEKQRNYAGRKILWKRNGRI
jgi:flagellin-like hook-associated protein FlgL